METAAPPTLLVVAAALVAADGRVCMHRRPPGKAHAGLWEFPGGKVEPGEGLRAALVREIAEELGVTLDPAALVPAGFAESWPPAGAGAGAPAVAILLYAARAWAGTAACLEGGGIGWFAPADLAALPMPPLDYPLAAGLVDLLQKGAI